MPRLLIGSLTLPQRIHWKKPAWTLLKVGLVALLIYSLYAQLGGRAEMGLAWQTIIDSWTWTNGLLLGLVIALISLNIGLEAVKWQWLLNWIGVPIGFWTSLRGIFTGTAVGIFTPNRVGEYGGRILVLPDHRSEGVATTLLCNFSQLIANVLVGTVMFGLYVYRYSQVEPTYFAYLFWLVAALVLTGLFAYFRLDVLQRWMGRQRWMENRFAQQLYRWLLLPVGQYSTAQLAQQLGLSLFRYGVYITQYLLLLYAFSITASVWQLVLLINCIYFLQSLLPSFTFIDMGVRGNLALFFFQAVTANKTAIIVASFSLWMINLMLPSLIGALVLLTLSTPKVRV